MRSRLLLLAGAAAAFAAAGAHARTDANVLIRPAQGIGKIRLGMTEAQVRRTMGRPRAVIRQPGGFGLGAVELEYGLAAYTVRLVGRRGQARVVRVGTTLVRERTRAGVGVGSLERRVLRAYPRLRCESLRTYAISGVTYSGRSMRDCVLFAPSGRRTTFTSGVRVNSTIGESLTLRDWNQRARVIEVSVSEAR
jgi:hypothetical protein